MKTLIAFLISCFLLSSGVLAADIDGTWKGTVPGPDGNPMDITYEFESSGNDLTGTVSTKSGSGPFSGGKIDGNKLSFSVEIPNNIVYVSGTLSGDVINMTQKKGDEVNDFTLKRVRGEKKPDETREGVVFGPDELKLYEGEYLSTRSSFKITLKIINNRLHWQPAGQSPYPLTPVSRTEFKFEPAGITFLFSKSSDGKIQFDSFVFDQRGKRSIFLKSDGTPKSALPEPDGNPMNKTRADILSEIDRIEPEFTRHTDNAEVRFTYSKLLYQSGDFRKAKDVITPLATSSDPAPDALLLAGELEYLLGNYAESKKLYKRLIGAKAAGPVMKYRAKEGLLLTYYQTNRFLEAQKLPGSPPMYDQMKAMYDQMKAFDTNPYQLEWHTPEKVSIVPFLKTDPMPLVPALTVEVNGEPVNMIFDTGGGELYLDSEIADAMGIKVISKAMGTYAGGLQAEYGYGKADSVKIGDVTLKQVPINIKPLKNLK